MADFGVRSIAPVIATLTTTLAAVAGLTVPTGKEWTIHTLRLTNIGAADATGTVSIGAAGELAYNYPVKVATSVNILGPDIAVLPAGTVIQARGSAASAVRLLAFITERDV